jgi:hypothetical protein
MNEEHALTGKPDLPVIRRKMNQPAKIRIWWQVQEFAFQHAVSSREFCSDYVWAEAWAGFMISSIVVIARHESMKKTSQLVRDRTISC